MTKNKKIVKILTCVLLLTVVISSVFTVCLSAMSGKNYGSSPSINRYDKNFETGFENYLDSNVMFKLPERINPDDRLSLIIEMPTVTLLDAYEKTDKKISFKEYYLSDAASECKKSIESEVLALQKKLVKAGVEFTRGETYDTVLSGFEITVKASEFENVCRTMNGYGKVIIGDEYEECKTELVENYVNVYGTGIFNSSEFGYDGEGTVVAVLDTGLDYFHSAFLPEKFTSDKNKLALTKDEVAAIIGKTNASEMQTGVTSSDLYINEKVPFGFDYADEDSDVFPLLSNHGTHVAGVIAGNKLDHIDAKDYSGEFVGVAPKAQLVIMKIFSDVEATARTSRIIAALEDCVVLGVDVINMSIGTGCGFSRETDKEAISGVYERIREKGISLVVAASNSFNSTYGSDKNGNLGLTSNPDSATVGSPSTYLGALSVASINGAKTAYLSYLENIIYFNESTDRVSDEKNFVKELLKEGQTEATFEYVTIPGAGRSADYTGFDVKGKLVLVKRGYTTFEEKANVAYEKGAAGIIIYNNVSGDIKMNVGETDIAAISISQDDGEILAEAGSGTIKISIDQTSGPFMSDFSSWGPTPDLKIKPEITAHGGSILSSVPGESYDRISGTSMACPNIAGASAIIRQYVKESDYFAEYANDSVAVTAIVNRLMMSTADIILNKNGLPYAVRKQGAGLANLTNTKLTTAYILTYNLVEDESGSKVYDLENVMDKPKIELGDDPTKSGVYTLVFSVDNFGSTDLNYNVTASVLTEGVSDTKTSHGETTVTETAYSLDGASVKIEKVDGGQLNGNTVSVAANTTATVTLTISLSESDKKYLDDSFENGMYVEGFVMLDALDSKVDLNVPYLAFYGDWTRAPLFDLDYYETNKDELDDSVDPLDKTLPDAYASRPIGGLVDDYMSFLGSYYFVQDPSKAIIAADRKYISLSNQENSINSLRFVWAGMLRGAERIEITITDDSTGEVVYNHTQYDVRKSYGDGGPISPANVKVEFSAIDNNLKNNTSYTVKLKGYLDYGDGGENTNLNNEFVFPLVTDFESPALTDCEFYTEYDRSTKRTRLFAKVALYDNHYAMAAQFGVFNGSFTSFDKYYTPIYSEFNSTNYVTYELTDHIDEIVEVNKALILSGLKKEGSPTFSLVCYDYAMNLSAYEIALPDNFTDLFFEEETITLSPYETYSLNPVIYPGDQWSDLLTYSSSNSSIVKVVGNKAIALAPGKAKIRVTDNRGHNAELKVEILSPGQAGYKKYDKPVTDSFILTGYYINRAFYQMAVEDRDLGMTGDTVKFANNFYSLSMYPSESIRLLYDLNAFFPESTKVVFESSDQNIVQCDKNTGTIIAVNEGLCTITVKVLMDNKSTFYTTSLDISVKDPYVLTGPSITHYFGAGTENSGVVEIPETLAVTEIGQFAFTNFDYVKKGADDEISDELPESMKIWFKQDSYIKEIVIPEGIKRIGPYAFAGLTELTKVTLPSTLETIDYGAFYGCTKLNKINGIGNVKFINQAAFRDTGIVGALDFKNAVAIADYAFANTKITEVTLSESTQSVGAYAFSNNESLTKLTINADKIKLGKYAFTGCTKLGEAKINSSVIPEGAFYNCKALSKMTIGKDVNVISEYAFMNTAISKFIIEVGNGTYTPGENSYILSGSSLILVAPAYKGANGDGDFYVKDASGNHVNITSVGDAAFSGNVHISKVELPYVDYVGRFAFSECSDLKNVILAPLCYIGDYAFERTALTEVVEFDEELTEIGNYAFSETDIKEVIISDGIRIGKGAFKNCHSIQSVRLGNNVVIGDEAFALDTSNYTVGERPGKDGKTSVYYIEYVSALTELTVGNDVNIGDKAFLNAAALKSFTLGSKCVIGNEAFINAVSLEVVDLSKVVSIGDKAFSGYSHYEYFDDGLSEIAYDEDGYYLIKTYGNSLKQINISGVTSIGKEAFSYAEKLESVILNPSLKTVADHAFYHCESLKNINLDNVETVGEYAFANTSLEGANLLSATSIGEYAFCECEELVSVVLGKESRIEEGAFSYCKQLTTVTGEEKASYIGDYGFAYTNLSEVDLSCAQYIGTQAFRKETLGDLSVKITDKTTDVGDNPFAYCKVAAFTTTTKESFNGKDYFTVTDTFDINESIKIIGGSVYRVVPYGLELITWCGDKDASVAEGTVRISALAFAGSNVKKVILPYTVRAIGHMAFYDCDDLALVVFSSYKAPILEEEYDPYYYLSEESIASTVDNLLLVDSNGSFIGFSPTEGLGVIPFPTYDGANNPAGVFYGANFIDRIGHIDSKITMVRPSNGRNYDSFVLGQYFNYSIDGKAAADEITLAAIAAISKLPSNATEITLDHKSLVSWARAAYDKILSDEQRGLVPDNLVALLRECEQMILDLEYLEEGDNESSDGNVTDNGDGLKVAIIVLIVVVIVLALAIIGLGILMFLLIKKTGIFEKKETADSSEDTDSEDSVEYEEESDLKDSDESEITEEPEEEVEQFKVRILDKPKDFDDITEGYVTDPGTARKKKIIALSCIGAIALAVVVGVIFAIINGNKSYYSDLNAQGYSINITFDSNGGSFKGSDSSIVDLYKMDQVGNDGLKILAPDDYARKENAMTVTKPDHFLAGWYQKMELVDPEDPSKGYKYSDKWDFESSRLKIDPSKTYSADKASLTLYAAWVPYYNFEIYVDNDKGEAELLTSVKAIELTIPEWEDYSVTLDMGNFPDREGYTLDEVFYYAEDGTKSSVEGILDESGKTYITGKWDEEKAISLIPTIKLFTTWKEGKTYKIYSAEDFVRNADAEGYYEIYADLDFTIEMWPAEFTNRKFSGKIFGNGHKIKNVTFNTSSRNSINNGLFSAFDTDVYIENITFENITHIIDTVQVATNATFGLLTGSVGEGATFNKVKLNGKIVFTDNCSSLIGNDGITINKVAGVGSTDNISAGKITFEKANAQNSEFEIKVNADGSVSIVSAP